MSVLLIPFTPQFFFVLLGVLIINLGIHYWNKQNLYEYLGTIPQLLILTRVAKKLLKCKILKEINENVPESIRSIEKVKRYMSLFKLEPEVQTDLGTASFIWSFEAIGYQKKRN